MPGRSQWRWLLYTGGSKGRDAGGVLRAGRSSSSTPLAPRPQIFFAEEHSKGRSYADLYELVQHAGNVLPRL